MKQDNTRNINQGYQLELGELIHIKKLMDGQFGPIHLVIKESLKKDNDSIETFVVKCIRKK